MRLPATKKKARASFAISRPVHRVGGEVMGQLLTTSRQLFSAPHPQVSVQLSNRLPAQRTGSLPGVLCYDGAVKRVHFLVLRTGINCCGKTSGGPF